MISNPAPNEMSIGELIPSYRGVYISHNLGTDKDIAGRAVYLNIFYHDRYVGDDIGTYVTGLDTESTYTNCSMVRYDSMVSEDDSFDPFSGSIFGTNSTSVPDFTTLTEPTITSVVVVAEQVDVGVGPPNVTINTAGEAEFVEVEYSEAGQNNWVSLAYLPQENKLDIAGMPLGTYDIRVRGIVTFPIYPFKEFSSWDTEYGVEVKYGYTPPTAPSNISFAVKKFAEPAERYDAEVSWDWEQGSGANVREFVLYRVPTSVYNVSGFDEAEVINVGTSKRYVIHNHEFQREYKYRVATIAWGPEGSNLTYSNVSTFTITPSTILTDFTVETGLEITYSHLKANRYESNAWKQTFLLDAATGSVSIGSLVNGVAPITVDGNTGTMNIQGGVISNEITAASYVLSNLNGNDSPSFKSAAKDSYGDATSGVFMGYNSSGAFEFDLGDSSKYIRWNGSTLAISGDVIIGSSSVSNLQAKVDGFSSTPLTTYRYISSISSIPSTNSGKSTDYYNSTGRQPQSGSTLIYYSPASQKYYRYSNSTSSWSVFNVVVDGSLLVSGTVAAAALQADSITGDKIKADTSIVVGSGDTSATLSGTGAYRFWAGNASAASAPFRVGQDGTVEINANATSSALVVKNNVIEVYDETGTLRVQIGELT